MLAIDAGHDHVQGLYHLQYSLKVPVREHEGQVPRLCRFKGGIHQTPGDPARGGAPAVLEVAQALNQHPSAEHVGKPCDMAPVTVGVLEGFGEVSGDEDSEVGVARTAVAVAVAVPVDGEDVMLLQVLGGHLTVGAHAKGPDLVVEGRGIEDSLDLVELVRDGFGYSCGYLNTHPDIHRKGLYPKAQGTDSLLHP